MNNDFIFNADENRIPKSLEDAISSKCSSNKNIIDDIRRERDFMFTLMSKDIEYINVDISITYLDKGEIQRDKKLSIVTDQKEALKKAFIDFIADNVEALIKKYESLLSEEKNLSNLLIKDINDQIRVIHNK